MTIAGNNLPHEFWSKDHRFGLKIGSSHIKDIVSQCIKFYPNETGGILVGFYNQKPDCAEVTNVIFAPRDSKMGKTWFIRGIHGLQSKLNRLWIRQEGYYLGEWHFHPRGVPIPSSDDINQMVNIALSPKAHCPEPLLLIFSCLTSDDSFSCRAYVFRDHQYSELFSQ